MDVAEVAREVAAGNERIRVEAPTAPAMASLNRLAACRILEELVDNALRSRRTDHPVSIRVDLGDGSPEVRVSDEGAGSTRSDPRIFGPLEQLEDTELAGASGHRDGPRARADLGAGDGRRRRPRDVRSRRVRRSLWLVERENGSARRSLEATHVHVQQQPAATQFASMADPP